jgi:hypothetical protein
MAAGNAGPVLRVRVRREGDKWQILETTRIDAMTLPRSQELPESQGRPLSGFWYELVDEKGAPQYRRIIRNPTEQSLELPSEKGGLERVDVERPWTEFDVLIPDRGGTRELLFFESDPRANDSEATIARAMQPVARLPIGKKPYRRRPKKR